mmetsp:Transcript_77902/g.225325  ORF Transcript_77902/g.225325 Transcript_77902/m.225325 type:complete len:260 (+) Transcript_77902:1552-2331(+)
MEGQVPGGVPGEFPLVGHGDDVAILHVVPIAVADGPARRLGRRRTRRVALEEGVDVEVVELFRPDHPGQSLALDAAMFIIGDVALERGVECVPLLLRRRDNVVEILEGVADVHSRQPHAERLATARRDAALRMEACLRSLGRRRGRQLTLDDIPVESVLVRPGPDVARRVVHRPVRRCGGGRDEGGATGIPRGVEVCIHRGHVRRVARAEVHAVVLPEGLLQGRAPRRPEDRVAGEVEWSKPEVVALQGRAIGLVVAQE